MKKDKLGINHWSKELSELKNVKSVIDVGVMTGTFDLYNSFPGAELILIDPLTESQNFIKENLKRKYTFYKCALSDTNGTTVINVSQNGAKSSLLKRSELTEATIVEQRNVDLKRLDSVLEDVELAEPCLLKIDTEGYDLLVLKGALDTIKKCKYIICEVSVKKRFSNSYRFEDLILFMVENRFTVKSVLEAPRSLLYLDILFEKQEALAS